MIYLNATEFLFFASVCVISRKTMKIAYYTSQSMLAILQYFFYRIKNINRNTISLRFCNSDFPKHCFHGRVEKMFSKILRLNRLELD